MLLTKLECLSEKILIIRALSGMFNDVNKVLLRLSSHFTVLLRNINASQWLVHSHSAECSGMKCPYVIEMGQFKQSMNMKHRKEKANINNVKDNQTDTKKRDCNWIVQEIELLLRKRYFSRFLVPFHSVCTLWNAIICSYCSYLPCMNTNPIRNKNRFRTASIHNVWTWSNKEGLKQVA